MPPQSTSPRREQYCQGDRQHRQMQLGPRDMLPSHDVGPATRAVAGMILIEFGSATFMLLGRHLHQTDPASISRTLQGLLSGISFLGGAVIFKSGTDVRGIKAAAAVWITGAIGLAIGTAYWWLGIIVGIATALVLFIADQFPDPVREAKQEEVVIGDRQTPFGQDQG